jgi:hypothetical protein
MVATELSFMCVVYNTAFLILCSFSTLHFIVTEAKTIGLLLKKYILSLSSRTNAIWNPK